MVIVQGIDFRREKSSIVFDDIYGIRLYLTSQHGAPSDESIWFWDAGDGRIGVFPAMIDASVLPRGRTDFDVHGYRVVAGAVEQRLAGEVRCVTL